LAGHCCAAHQRAEALVISAESSIAGWREAEGQGN
jgi:hypothetical protein